MRLHVALRSHRSREPHSEVNRVGTGDRSVAFINRLRLLRGYDRKLPEHASAVCCQGQLSTGVSAGLALGMKSNQRPTDRIQTAAWNGSARSCERAKLLADPKRFVAFERSMRQWWRTHTDYDAAEQYSTKRLLSATIQISIALGTAFNGVSSLLVLKPAADTDASLGRGCVRGGAVGLGFRVVPAAVTVSRRVAGLRTYRRSPSCRDGIHAGQLTASSVRGPRTGQPGVPSVQLSGRGDPRIRLMLNRVRYSWGWLSSGGGARHKLAGDGTAAIVLLALESHHIVDADKHPASCLLVRERRTDKSRFDCPTVHVLSQSIRQNSVIARLVPLDRGQLCGQPLERSGRAD